MDLDQARSKPRQWKEYAYLVLTGITMGSADVVPGVSGGTMAFIMGVYQELVEAIKSFNVALLKKALRFDLKAVFDHIPWRFLACLLSGIFLAIAGLVHAISWCLEHQEAYLYSLFFGLVLASIAVISVQLKKNVSTVFALIAGAAFAWWIVGLVPQEMDHGLLTVFLSAMVAITAMILPGISGSFILLILGQYAFIIESIKEFNIPVLLVFALGCVLGLMGFSRALSWLLKHAYSITVAVLVGFMIGSLRKIWPFKEVVQTMVDRHGVVVPIETRNILPDVGSASFWISLGLAGLGVLLILGITRIRSATVDLKGTEHV